MVRLQLHDCRKITSLPSFGKLPALETLNIEDMLGWEEWSRDLDDNAGGEFPKLIELTLRNCPKLVGKLPSCLPSLERLHVYGCLEAVLISMADLPSLTALRIREISGLSSLDGTLKGLVALKDLQVEYCKQLKYLWQDGTDLNNLANLIHLKISNCEKLASLVEGEEGILPCNLQILDIHGCKNLEKLPNGLHNLTSLRNLEIERCAKLVSFPEGVGLPCALKYLRIQYCDSLKSLPDGMMMNGNNSNQCLLEKLDIQFCPSLKSFPPGKLPTTLKFLYISNCENLESLSDGIMYPGDPSDVSSSHSRLESFSVQGNSLLRSLPAGQFPSSLKEIVIKNFNSFPTGQNFPTFLVTLQICNCRAELLPSLRRLSHLTRLTLGKCPELESFPQGGLPLPKLVYLYLWHCGKLRCLPDNMGSLKSLRVLEVNHCSSLVSFPASGLPSNLTTFRISSCPKLTKPMSEWGLHTLTSVKHLSIDFRSPCAEIDVESFPDDGGLLLPTSLTFLQISYHKNLKSISKGIQRLTSLRKLFIVDCPKVQFLPKEGLPATLGYLRVRGCPLLEERYKKRIEIIGPSLPTPPKLIYLINQ